MSEKKELNPQYLINSLRNQLNEKCMHVAELEAMVGQLSEELKEEPEAVE